MGIANSTKIVLLATYSLNVSVTLVKSRWANFTGLARTSNNNTARITGSELTYDIYIFYVTAFLSLWYTERSKVVRKVKPRKGKKKFLFLFVNVMHI